MPHVAQRYCYLFFEKKKKLKKKKRKKAEMLVKDNQDTSTPLTPGLSTQSGNSSGQGWVGVILK